jgi:hypothetical protein
MQISPVAAARIAPILAVAAIVAAVAMGAVVEAEIDPPNAPEGQESAGRIKVCQF